MVLSATDLPIKGQVGVRITDDVLEEEDWGIDYLIIRGGVVVRQLRCTEGSYRTPNMIGWTREQLAEWSQYDDTGQHPENYHEVTICT
ncbi:MAG: hypothetical protein JRE23_17085 [Deltaproteobacteria bacterium]|nr:hypothetical protein [Deltaproteobacteria bacterium]